ncbi:MAG: RpiB/LacA/LacB family sugar-phosphate isomerase [bacterium]|jgi:ribose 5-phosphate isomerase B|nr:RpiB/LacA/LacB family sugar-phosphate isomerase [bacterium]
MRRPAVGRHDSGVVLITAERVRREAGAAGGGRLLLPRGRSVLTDEARDLAHRLGVVLEWVEDLPRPVAAEAGENPARRDRVQVALASDHGGYACRLHLARELEKAGYTVRDLGCPDPAPTDYPLWAALLAREVAGGGAARGIMLDTVGVASAMVCNRVPGVRAAACESLESVTSSRRHNDANLLTLGARLGEQACLALALAWLAEPYEGGRHQRRVDMIMALDRPGS